MIHYLQIERKANLTVPANGNLIFDNIVSNSGSSIIYDTITGEIEFTNSGVYYLNWFVAQQAGLSPIGSNFGIKSSDVADEDIIASCHVKISSITGFAIINVSSGGKTISLVNETGHGATLSAATLVKAGLAVFEVSESLTPTPEVLGFTHVQNEAGTIEITHGNNIIFDDIISRDGDDIVEYDDTTGIFTINAAGKFLAAWQIPINATDTSPDATIDLHVDEVSHSSYYMPLPIGVLSGSAVIQVGASASVTVHLENASNNIIRVTPNANLTITQLI